MDYSISLSGTIAKETESMGFPVLLLFAKHQVKIPIWYDEMR